MLLVVNKRLCELECSKVEITLSTFVCAIRIASCPWSVNQVHSQIIGDGDIRIGLALQHPAKQNWPIGCSELANSFLHFWSKVPHESLDWPGGSVSQCANCTAFYLFPGGNVLELSLARQKGTHVNSRSISISRSCPLPTTKRSIMFIIQVVPSRHGVHCPQDSCL